MYRESAFPYNIRTKIAVYYPPTTNIVIRIILALVTKLFLITLKLAQYYSLLSFLIKSRQQQAASTISQLRSYWDWIFQHFPTRTTMSIYNIYCEMQTIMMFNLSRHISLFVYYIVLCSVPKILYGWCVLWYILLLSYILLLTIIVVFLGVDC